MVLPALWDRLHWESLWSGSTGQYLGSALPLRETMCVRELQSICEQRGAKISVPLQRCVPLPSYLLLKLPRVKKLDIEIRNLAIVNKSTHGFYSAVIVHFQSLLGCFKKRLLGTFRNLAFIPFISVNHFYWIWSEKVRKLKTENCRGKWGLPFLHNSQWEGQTLYVSFLTNS